MPTPEEVAQFVAERAREDPKVRKVIEDVKLYDGLIEHAGWQRLSQRIAAMKDSFMAGITRRLMAGEVVDQRLIDFQRGFFAGAEYVIEMPAKAESSLEEAASKAWRLAQLELASEVEESSPYIDDDPPGGKHG